LVGAKDLQLEHCDFAMIQRTILLKVPTNMHKNLRLIVTARFDRAKSVCLLVDSSMISLLLHRMAYSWVRAS
jgi:hypothetical protein